METPKFQEYLLIPWPYYQSYENEIGFKKHSIVGDSPDDVMNPIFVEKAWFEGLMESKQFDDL